MAKFINSDHLETSLRKVKEYLDNSFNNIEATLTDNIVNSANETKTTILSNVEENYINNQEYEEFAFYTTTTIEQATEDLNIKFDQTSENIQIVDTKLNEFIEQVNSDISLINDEINMNKDPYAININEEGISFTQSSKEIAGIRDEEMEVTKLSVSDSLSLHGFKFIPRTTGNISLVWDDGVSALSSRNTEGDEE